MSMSSWGGKLQNGLSEVWVSALDEDRLAIEILGGADDVRFTVSHEAFLAIVASVEAAIRDKEEKIESLPKD